MFYSQYGIPIKEGLYQDFDNRDALLELVKFKTNKSDELISLEKYVSNMKKFKMHYPKWKQFYNSEKIIDQLLSNSQL